MSRLVAFLLFRDWLLLLYALSLFNMDELVFLEETHRMLVCRVCSAAVRPRAAIKHHFSNVHKTSGDVLQEIAFAYEDADVNDPVTATLPEDGSPAVPELPTHRGHRCTQCSFRTKTRDCMTRHWRVAAHEADGVRHTEVMLQSWCKGRYARYWVVGEGGTSDAGLVSHSPSPPSQLDAVLDQGEKELAAEDAERLRKADVEEGVDRDSSWVKRVAWVRHFGPSRDLAAVAQAAQWIRAKGEQAGRRGGQEREDEAAKRTQRQIVQLGASFCREVERCCFRIDSVPVRTRQLLNNIEPRKVVGVPFQRKALGTSMDKYKLVGQRFLMFCYRAYQLGRKEAEA